MSDVQLKYWLLLFFFYFYFWHLWRYNFAICFLPAMIETTKYKEYKEQKDFWKCHFVRSYNLFYFQYVYYVKLPYESPCLSVVGRSLGRSSVCHYFPQEGREVSHPCSYGSSCYLHSAEFVYKRKMPRNPRLLKSRRFSWKLVGEISSSWI